MGLYIPAMTGFRLPLSRGVSLAKAGFSSQGSHQRGTTAQSCLLGPLPGAGEINPLNLTSSAPNTIHGLQSVITVIF